MLKHIAIEDCPAQAETNALNLVALLRDVSETSFLHIHGVSIRELGGTAVSTGDQDRVMALLARLQNRKRLLQCNADERKLCRVDFQVGNQDETRARIRPIAQYITSPTGPEIIRSRAYLNVGMAKPEFERLVLAPMMRTAERLTFVDKYIRLGFDDSDLGLLSRRRYHDSFSWYCSVRSRYGNIKNCEIITSMRSASEYRRLVTWGLANNVDVRNIEMGDGDRGGVPHGRYILTNAVGIYVDVGLDLIENDRVRPTEIFAFGDVTGVYNDIVKRRSVALNEP